MIPGQAILQIVEKKPQFTLHMLVIMGNRLQMTGKRESALAFPYAQARLAHHTGLIRQIAAKALGKWRRSDWLITGGGRTLILNR